MIKEIPYLGVSSNTTDYDSKDGELALTGNVIADEQGLVTPSTPTEVIDLGLGNTPLFIHSAPSDTDGEHYIYLDGTTLKWRYKELLPDPGTIAEGVGTIKNISAVGNILVVIYDDSQQYYLWKDNEYKAIPNTFALNMQFGLDLSYRSKKYTGCINPKVATAETEDFDETLLSAALNGGESIILSTPFESSQYDVELEQGQTYRFKRTHTRDLGQSFVTLYGYTEGNAEITLIDNNFHNEITFTPSGNCVKVKVKLTSSYPPASELTPLGKCNISIEGSSSDTSQRMIVEKTEEATNAVLGAFNDFIDTFATSEDKFLFPFFVRYGLRMYDGNIIYASSPILMVPNGAGAPSMFCYDLAGEDPSAQDGMVASFVADLRIRIDQDTTFQSIIAAGDIFTSVVISASSPISTYDYDFDYTKRENEMRIYIVGEKTGTPGTWRFRDNYYSYGMDSSTYDEALGNVSAFGAKKASELATPTSLWQVYTPKVKDLAKKYEVNSSTFFIIKEIPVAELADYSEMTTIQLEEGTLASLETRQQLDTSRLTMDKVIGNTAYTYNDRLNIADVTTDVFKGWNYALEVQKINYNYNDDRHWRFRHEVSYIGDDGKEQNIAVPASLYNDALFRWFYVPFKASSVRIYAARITGSNTDRVYTITRQLKEHGVLGGSFYINEELTDNLSDWDIMSGDEADVMRALLTDPAGDTEGNAHVYTQHRNMLYQSEPNNPFAYQKKNQLTIGNGRIITMAANTRAISEGQFGAYPLYVFTDEGVYSLSLGNTGEYLTSHPATRDVVLGNGESVTQTDNSILFATMQGIMELQGNNSHCISYELDNKLQSVADIAKDLVNQVFPVGQGQPPTAGNVVPFKDYLDGSRIIYDYLNQRVIVYNPEYTYAYIYSLKTKSWGYFPNAITGNINSYPEAYAINGNKIIDLSSITSQDNTTEQPIINSGWFLTRPISLGTPNEFKVVDYVRQNGIIDPILKDTSVSMTPNNDVIEYANAYGGYKGASIQQVLLGSNDLITWSIVSSSQSQRISDYSGSPYKWFRLAVKCTFKPGQSLSSVTFSYRQKFSNDRLL